MGILAEKDLPFFPPHQEVKIFTVYLFVVHGLVAAVHGHAARGIARPDKVFSPVKVGQNIPPKIICLDPADGPSREKRRRRHKVESGSQGKGQRRVDPEIKENQKGRQGELGNPRPSGEKYAFRPPRIPIFLQDNG